MTTGTGYRSRERGDTLIEVLVAILVLSFGLLSLVALLANSLKLTSTSNYRTIAAEQATSMAEEMRANTFKLPSYMSTTGPTATVATTCYKAAGCVPDSMLKMQTALWQERLAALLPGGTGLVCRDSTAASRAVNDSTCDGSGPMVVKICWDESSRIQASGRNTSGTLLANSKTCTWTNI
jgi:type IV pilus assembly protein PilV